MVWRLTNSTPFAAEYTFARDKDGAEVGLVVVKGTFTIDPQGVPIAAKDQVPVVVSPEYVGEPGQSSLRYDWDFPLSKQTTDVLLNGHAYAPGGKTAPQVEVRMKVGPIDKALRVVGDRRWQKNWLGYASTDPIPFAKMPIVYERAFGGGDMNQRHGWDGRNPVGTGFTRDSDKVEALALPNIEFPGDTMSSWKSRPRPAGFGAIPPNWEPRVKYAGTYDERWEQERFPLLPRDFDHRFNQCAPPDQQPPSFLRGGVAVELHNLTPGGLLRFQLPRVVLGLATDIAGQTLNHPAVLYTVIVEPDFPRVVLVWHSAVACKNKAQRVTRTRIWEKDWVALGDTAPDDEE